MDKQDERDGIRRIRRAVNLLNVLTRTHFAAEERQKQDLPDLGIDRIGAVRWRRTSNPANLSIQ